MFRRKHRSESDFSEELLAHLELEIDRLRAEGLSEDEAFHVAHRNMGNLTTAGERFYESNRWVWVERLIKSVGYALRQLRSSPISTATVVFSLALGIGVNTAIFSLADQVLLRSLPVQKPEELVLLNWSGNFVGGGVGSDNSFPAPFFRDLRKENDVFADVFARHPTDVQFSTGHAVEPTAAEIVSGSYFTTLGVRPVAGRLLSDADDVKLNAHPVVVISYDYWRTRMSGDRADIGKRVFVNNFPMTIVGVAEQGFHGVDVGSPPALWIPMMMKREATPAWDALFDRRTRWLHIFGRLKPGITAEIAQTRMQPWFANYLRADTRREGWPQLTASQMKEYMGSQLQVMPAPNGRSDLRLDIRAPMLILLAATALVLLLACLNVANLSLARALARRRATALKAALGASRGRILSEQFIESFLLAAAGCAAGVVLAPPVSRALLNFLPRDTAVAALTGDVDVRVLFFAAGITMLTTILCGSAPALYAASVPPVNALKEQSGAVAAGFSARKMLVVGQFALALILLIGAGLFGRTLANLRDQGPGFRTTNLLMFRVDPLAAGYSKAGAKPLVQHMLKSIQELPEVEHAGAARFEMLVSGGWANPLTVQTHERIATENTRMNAVTPGFFETLGARITRGRGFDQRDSTDLPGPARSAIVNEEFVRRYLNGSEPLGALTGIGDRPDTIAGTAIVGVVESFHDAGLRKPEPEIFYPLWETGVDRGMFLIRSRNSSEAAARSIENVVRGLDPRLPVLSLRTIDDQLDRMLKTERMLATLAGAFAAVATLLAMIGLYAVLTFSAAQRTKEMGIRMALGAPRWSAGELIVREAAAMAITGLAIAIPVSWALGRLIRNQLYGITAMDPLTVAGAAFVLVMVCLAASFVPARRAASVSPWETLRSE